MPPEGIYSLLDRGQFLFQFVHQHAGSPVYQVRTVLIIPQQIKKTTQQTGGCDLIREDVIRQAHPNNEHIQINDDRDKINGA